MLASTAPSSPSSSSIASTTSTNLEGSAPPADGTTVVEGYVRLDRTPQIEEIVYVGQNDENKAEEEDSGESENADGGETTASSPKNEGTSSSEPSLESRDALMYPSSTDPKAQPSALHAQPPPPPPVLVYAAPPAHSHLSAPVLAYTVGTGPVANVAGGPQLLPAFPLQGLGSPFETPGAASSTAASPRLQDVNHYAANGLDHLLRGHPQAAGLPMQSPHPHHPSPHHHHHHHHPSQHHHLPQHFGPIHSEVVGSPAFIHSLGFPHGPPHGPPHVGGHDVRQGDWVCPECRANVFGRHISCFRCATPKPDSGAQHGEWLCLVRTCGAHNFAFRTHCYRCTAIRGTEKRGDWICNHCHGLNFTTRLSCFRCHVPRPVEAASLAMASHHVFAAAAAAAAVPLSHQTSAALSSVRPGDWLCPNPTCRSNVFAVRLKCLRCNEPKPDNATIEVATRFSDARPGDWCCGVCQTWCFAHRATCFRCNSPKPHELTVPGHSPSVPRGVYASLPNPAAAAVLTMLATANGAQTVAATNGAPPVVARSLAHQKPQRSEGLPLEPSQSQPLEEQEKASAASDSSLE